MTVMDMQQETLSLKGSAFYLRRASGTMILPAVMAVRNLLFCSPIPI
jgi:hypothetical protein